MNKSDKRYDKTLLVLLTVVALATAGLLIWLSQGFADTLVLKKGNPKNELGEVPIAQVDEAMSRLRRVFDWRAPIRANKPVPLNKSILLVLKDDHLYDLFVEAPQFRPPMTNEFLVRYNLPHLLHENVGELDPDEDGFSNEEEFLASTHPRDPNSKPPATQKLYLKARITNDYILKLNSSTMPVQVARIAPEPRSSKFVQPGEEFGFDRGVIRFKAVSFQQKTVPDPVVTERDASELTVLDMATKREFVLVRSVEFNLAEFEARFEYALGDNKEFTVKKGENFQLPGTGETYKVVEIEETSAKIAKVDAQGQLGPEIEVKMR